MMDAQSHLLLLAFGTFCTALVLGYLAALWTRPLLALALVLTGLAATVAFAMMSQAEADAGTSTGAGLLILAGVTGIATVGALVGAVYGAWKVRGRT